MTKEDKADTSTQEPAKTDWEKRYKDAQAELTKKSQELSDTKKEYAKDKELLDTVTPYIDWKAVNGEPKEDNDEPVSRKELDDKIAKLESARRVDQTMSDFRRKYPDMVDYEDQIGFYFHNKTDPRSKPMDRIAKAVEYTKNFLDTERAKGVSSAQEKVEETKKKEAEASGLKEKDSKEPPEPEGESYDDYIASRKAQHARGMGVAVTKE
jgi:hypothetical protein